MAPRFSHAEARQDGGTDFFSPEGKKTTLYGQQVAAYGASLPRPPSMATSEGALADASGSVMPQPSSRPLAWEAPGNVGTISAPDVQGPKAEDAGFGVYGARERSTSPLLSWLETRREQAAIRGNDRVVEYPAVGPKARAEAEALAAAKREAGGAAEGPPADGAKPDGAKPAAANGPAIGIGDVTPKTADEAKAAGFSDLDDARAAYKAALEAETRGSGGPTKARWQGTTRSTVREGVESDATAAARQAALDAQGAASGRQAEVARGQDLADEAALREAARRNQGSLARYDAAAAIEEKALLDRERRLRAEADEGPLGISASSPLGKISRALTQAGESSGAMEGDAILTSANGGGSVASIMAAKQAAKEARLGRQDRQNDEADKARANIGQLRTNIEKIKSPEYADHLTNVLKANSAQYKATGRLPELEASLALLEDKKAALRGAREAAQMGTTTSGEKFIPATSGAANRAAALARYGDRMLHVAGAQNQADATDARAAGKAKPAGSIVIDQRIPIDPNLPPEVRNQLFKEAEAQEKASAALDDVAKARAELGWRRFLPDSWQGQTGARLRAGIQEFARHESVAQGQNGLQDADRRAAEGLLGGAYDAEGAILQKRGSLERIKKDLKRKASGELWPTPPISTKRPRWPC